MSGRLVVIGGCGPGLGAALARRFARRGDHVATLSRSGFLVENTQTFVTDLADGVATSNVIANISADIGLPDIYVHNVQALHAGGYLEHGPDTFERLWRASVLSLVHVADVLIPGMIERGSGTLLITGATASLRGGPRMAAFASAKFALRGLAQSLAREFQPKGIHVAHVILDGLMRGTPSVSQFGGKPETSIDPDDAARAYLALADQPRSAWTHEIDIRPFCERF